MTTRTPHIYEMGAFHKCAVFDIGYVNLFDV